MAQSKSWRGVVFSVACLTLALLVGSAGLRAQTPDDLGVLNAKVGELRLAGKYSDALALARRYVAQSKARFGETSAEYATSLESLAETYFAQSQFDDAEPIYLQVLTLREKILGPHHADVLATLATLASVYRASRRPQLAEPLLTRILADREQATPPHPSSMAETLKSLAEVELALARYGEAEAHIRRAISLTETPGDNLTQNANLLVVLAQIKRSQGDLEGAATILQRSLSLHDKATEGGKAELLAQAAHVNALAQMAALSQQMKRFDVADEMVERVAVESEKMLGPHHPIVAGALEAVANSYERQGRLAEAEVRRKRAIDINEQAFGQDHINVALSLQALGNLYALQYRFEEATHLLLRALGIAETNLGPKNPALFDYLASLGEIYVLERNWGEAEPSLTRALAGLENAQGPDPVNSAVKKIRILQDLAYLNDLQDRPHAAQQFLEKALATSERDLGPQHDSTGDVLSALAVHALGENRLDDAVRLFDRAQPISEKSGHSSRRYANTVAGIGVVNYRRENWAKAHSSMKTASAIYIELEQRGAAGVPAQRDAARPLAYDEFFLSQAVAAYRLAALDTGHADDLGNEAFQLAQRTQNSQAAAALSQMAARFASGTTALSALMRERQDQVGQWQAIDAHLTTALSTPPDQRDTAREDDLRARLADAGGRIDLIDGRLAREFPAYATLANPQPLSIEGVQKSLAAKEVLIFVASLPQQSLLWAIGRDSAHVVLVPMGTEQLSREVSALRCGLDGAAWEIKGASSCQSLLGISRQFGRPLPFDLSRSHALYNALFSRLKDKIEGKQLLIAAIGPLASLPFSVLVTEPPGVGIPSDATKYAEAAWLAKRHAVTTLPSVASLASLRLDAKPSLATKPFIGFGNPLLAGRDGTNRSAWQKESCSKLIVSKSVQVSSRGLPDGLEKLFTGKLADTQVLRRQNPLPETADELCAVGGELTAGEGDINLGSRATESAVKSLNESGQLATYRTVHFATHGLLAGETESVGGAAEPSLLLTPPGIATGVDDGLLTSSEVAQLKLDADWIVLSACNTAGGGKRGGEALSGLSRAFFYAGARALLVSHWYVDSDAAVKLVTDSFAELRGDPSIGRAEALRRAMIDVMNDTSRPKRWTPAAHPSVWAPFVVVGEGGASR